jgi:TPR repeat protein
VAQFNLGLLYAKGQGVARNYSEAVRWWRKAAEQGQADAQSGLGVLHFNGDGVALDYVKAHMWFNLAAEAGAEAAAENRDLVASHMTPAQIAEARRLAANLTVGGPITGWNVLSSNEIRAVQQALNAAGYDAGPADGDTGPRTRSALEAFQRSKGLPVGEPDQATLQALGMR